MTAVLERPGLIIIGPGRSGTTALFEAMNRHPDIAGSKVKETFYFTRRTIALAGTMINILVRMSQRIRSLHSVGMLLVCCSLQNREKTTKRET